MKTSRSSLREVAAVFLRLGVIGFGGPAAHIALMRQELVARKHWLSDEHFLDILGATNLIPGPNSTEVAIHIGAVRAGWRGLVAGACFILPAMLIVMGFAWAYTAYGSTPEIRWLLYGIKPVIIAVVLQALFGLARPAAKNLLLVALGVAVFALYLAGVNELLLLFGGPALVLLIVGGRRLAPRLRSAVVALPLALPALAVALSNPVAKPADYSSGTLFLTFLKIGSVLYGSGYVLLAFLRNDFVVRLHWLTDQQLLDAVAVGQVTPGPVFTTATFIGFVLGGVPGALLATLAIFLPSFVFVALLQPLLPRLRSSTLTAPLLDAVNVAALGLMAGVTVTLARDAIVDAPTALVATAAAVSLIGFRANSAVVIAGGALFGIVYRAVI